jgi:hypothetical protein
MRWPSCALNSQAKCEPIPGVEGGFYFPSAYEGEYQYFPTERSAQMTKGLFDFAALTNRQEHE